MKPKPSLPAGIAPHGRLVRMSNKRFASLDSRMTVGLLDPYGIASNDAVMKDALDFEFPRESLSQTLEKPFKLAPRAR